MHTSEEDSEGAQCAALCGDTYGFTKVALVQDLYIAPEKNAFPVKHLCTVLKGTLEGLCI